MGEVHVGTWTWPNRKDSMMEFELESFSPRVPYTDGAVTWSAFVRGKANVERIVDLGARVRVMFKDGVSWLVTGDGIGKEMAREQQPSGSLADNLAGQQQAALGVSTQISAAQQVAGRGQKGRK